MKNIIKKHRFIVLLFVMMFLWVSCSDALDIRQKGEGDRERVYNSVDDLQLALNGAYLRYGPDFNSNGDGDVILFNDLVTDNIKKGVSNAGQGVGIYQWTIETRSVVPRIIWSNRYATIKDVNVALSQTDRIEQTMNPNDQKRFNNIKAQLLVLRAICHYDIFMYYTSNYADQNALSAIIMDYVPEVSDQPERNKVSEVVSFISQDLNQAKDLIDSATNDPFRINADVIDAFRAKLAIANADYNLAGTLAQELLGKYPLASRDDYKKLFEDLGNEELIFGLTRVRGNNGIAGSWYTNATNVDGAPWFEMSEQLYNLYQNGDVRINEVLLDETSNISEKMFLINKYPGVDGDLLRNDVKVVRSSEMVFILAEAQARAGDFVSSGATLQDLINIRYAPNIVPSSENVTFSNLSDALNRILLERRKELCFEGHRYLDLKRFGVGINRLESDAKTFSPTTPTNLSAGDYRFTLPIPQTEINGNPNITQNNGYTNN